MTSEGVIFESVLEWEHLVASDELFERKYHNSILNYKREVQALKDLYKTHLDLTAQSSQNKVKNEEDNLDYNRKKVENYIKNINSSKQEIEKLSSASIKLKKSCEELSERLSSLEKEGELLIEQKSDFAKEVKDTYDAHLRARSYYKDNLHMHYTIDTLPENTTDVILTIKFFTIKKNKESKYSLTLRINKSEHKAVLLSTNPKLSIFDQLNKRLMESGDYSGLICCVRNCFIKLNGIKQ